MGSILKDDILSHCELIKGSKVKDAPRLMLKRSYRKYICLSLKLEEYTYYMIWSLNYHATTLLLYVINDVEIKRNIVISNN